MQIEINNTTRTKVDIKKIKSISQIFSRVYNNHKDISIAFIGDVKMRQINKAYRNKDKTTDVLSFNGDKDNLGEILISLAQIKRQAKVNKKTMMSELIFILVHGLLHLIGKTDNSEIQRLAMIEEGEVFIKKYLNKC